MSALAGRRILLVEDEMIVLMLLEDMLEEFGCTIVERASRPAEALAAIEAQPIDAAILDINLDGEDSYGVAAALAARNVPFLFATGYGDLTLKDEFRGRTVLKKPFRSHDLEQALAGVLGETSGAPAANPTD